MASIIKPIGAAIWSGPGAICNGAIAVYDSFKNGNQVPALQQRIQTLENNMRAKEETFTIQVAMLTQRMHDLESRVPSLKQEVEDWKERVRELGNKQNATNEKVSAIEGMQNELLQAIKSSQEKVIEAINAKPKKGRR